MATAPIEQPRPADPGGTTQNAVSGGGWTISTSGTVPTSGITSAIVNFNGPWRIETQTLDITYYRQPIQTTLGGQHVLTLSGYNASSNLAGTFLVCNSKATHRIHKDTNSFYTSGYQQPQKFEIFAASTDSDGMSYGDVSSGSALGPAGAIITSQKYYNRRLWVDASDTASVCSVDAFTNAYLSGTGPNIWLNSNFYWTTEEYTFKRPEHRYSPLIPGEHFMGAGVFVYQLPGNYSTEQENNITKIWGTIDYIGLLIASENMIRSEPFNSNGFPYIVNADSIGIPAYSINYHNYN